MCSPKRVKGRLINEPKSTCLTYGRFKNENFTECVSGSKSEETRSVTTGKSLKNTEDRTLFTIVCVITCNPLTHIAASSPSVKSPVSEDDYQLGNH